jgi:DNA-binding transcriptional LysR family regulator
LTDAGQVFLQHVERAMGELAAARHEVDALRGLRRGTVNFGVTPGFSRELLPQLLARFHEAHPQVEYKIEVASSPRLVELALSDEVDFALTFNPPARAGLTIIAQRDVGSCVMMPRNHPLASRPWVRLSECEPYELVMPDKSLALRATLDHMFSRVGMKPRILLTTNSYELMRTATAAGLGIAVLTQFLFGHDPNYPNAVFVPVRDERIKSQVLVCCIRAGRHLPAASASFVAEVQRLLREGPAEARQRVRRAR